MTIPTQGEDLVLVPREPTREMLDRAQQDAAHHDTARRGYGFRDTWLSMISASPSREERGPSCADRSGRGGIYVASRASVLARGAMWRSLRDKGVPIVSTWIDEDGENDTAELSELWTRICREVTGARLLVLYVEPDDFPLKGAFVEVGMALAAGVPIKIVAPGVVLSGRNLRPIGSWCRHPLVSFHGSIAAALLSDAPAPSGEAPPLSLKEDEGLSVADSSGSQPQEAVKSDGPMGLGGGEL